MKSKIKNQKSKIDGQTVIEVLIGLSLLALVFSGVALVVFSNKSVLTDKKLASEAEGYASEGIEAAKSIAWREWTELGKGSYGIIFNSTTSEWEFSGSSTKRDGFTRVVTVNSDQDDEVKTVTSRVTWALESSPRILESKLTLRLTDWRGVASSGGDPGGTGIVPDWTNACTLGTVDLGTAVRGTDIDVLNKIAYITTIHPENDKKDFNIIDATNGNNPTILSQIHTGPGLNAIDVITGYAFVAQDKTSDQLQIIDIANTGAPTTTATYNLPGISGSGAKGRTVFYRSDTVYVGVDQATGPEFHLIDVTNKNSPTEIGSYEVGAAVYRAFVRGSKAYLATADNSKELLVLDISDPDNITQAASYNATGTTDAFAVFVVGNKLYLGRDGDSNSSNHEFIILDISDLNSITVLGSKELGVDVNDIYVRDDFAFVSTDDSNKEFQVLNVDNPINITERISFNYPQIANGSDYESNFVYVSVRSNDTLRIITSEGCP